MAFDADNAGQEAMKRGIDAALADGMSVRVIKIPEGAGKDADECIKKDKSTWFKTVENAMEVMTWYFTGVLAKYNVLVPHEKQLAANALINEIAKLVYPVERDDWLRRLAEQLNIDAAILREELKKAIKNKNTAPIRAPATSAQPTTPVVTASVPIKRAPPSPIQKLAEGLWLLIIKWSELYPGIRSSLQADYFVNTDFGGLYELAEKQYNDNNKIDLTGLRELSIGAPYDIDILSLRAEKDFSQLNIEGARKELSNFVHNLGDKCVKIRRQELQSAIAVAERAGDTSTVMELLQKLQSI